MLKTDAHAAAATASTEPDVGAWDRRWEWQVQALVDGLTQPPPTRYERWGGGAAARAAQAKTKKPSTAKAKAAPRPKCCFGIPRTGRPTKVEGY